MVSGEPCHAPRDETEPRVVYGESTSPRVIDTGGIRARQIRKVPADLRKEVFSYVPRERILGMEPGAFYKVMHAHGKQELGREFLRALG